MKSNISIISIIIALTVGNIQGLFACGGSYTPRYYNTLFRVSGEEQTGLSAAEIKERNIQLWMKQTRLGHAQVEELVYGDCFDADRCSQLLEGKDAEIGQLLALARQCEATRGQLTSAWYYAVEGDEPHTTLLDIVEQAEAGFHKGGLMKERFALQAIRALFALRQYAECIAFWNEADGQIQAPVLRDMALPYIAGCYYHLHEAKKAMPIFIHYGDVQSAILCGRMIDYEQTGLDFESSSVDDNEGWIYCLRSSDFVRTATYCPDVPGLASHINLLLAELREQDAEYQHYYHYYNSVIPDTYLEAALKAGSRSHGENTSLWYYAAACLCDANEQPQEALHWLAEAKKRPHNRMMDDYMRVLADVIYFRTAKLDDEYYRRIEEEVRWFDKKLVNNFDHLTISPYLHQDYFGYYGVVKPFDEAEYWNMVIRNIVIDAICAQLDKQKDYDSMLKLTNYAENRYLQLCDGAFMRERLCWQFSSVTGEWERCDDVITTEQKYSYRDYQELAGNQWNDNYRTKLFALSDSLTANQLADHIHWLSTSHSGFDNLLWRGCNANMDYWQEQLGTHLLRECRFEEAARALARVSDRFNCHTNLYKGRCMDRNPFSTDCYHQNVEDNQHYKLDYARQMAQLLRVINQTNGDVDDRAEAMLRYSVGLRNSVGGCWSLTQYSMESGDEGQGVRYAGGRYVDQIVKQSETFERVGFAIFSDRERKARALARHHRRLEVMRDYRDTEMAWELEHHCDLWRDYARKHPVQNN